MDLLQGSFVIFHGFILILVYWMKDWKPELQLIVLFCCMLSLDLFFNRIGVLKKYFKPTTSNLTATQPE
jgi:hypothetical protein